MKRLIPIIIVVLLFCGCAGFNKYAERDWHEKTQKWAIEQNKKCPIKNGRCFTLTSIKYTPTMLTYNQEISGAADCKSMVGDIKRTSDAEMRTVVRQRLANKVALMNVSLRYCFFDEHGNLIKELFVRKDY